MTTRPNSVQLCFSAKRKKQRVNAQELREDLSSVERTGPNLWLASDEAMSLERLTETKDGRYENHVSFRILDYVELPANEKEEIDLEGIAASGGYLWIVGSHSQKRKKPGKGDLKERLQRLATVSKDDNRYFIARIPLVLNPETGEYELRKCARHPSDPERELHAARLVADEDSSQLLELLKEDEHLAPFIGLPGKDNGFNIEGLAATDENVFLGLRGPVLRGYAVVLRLQFKKKDDSRLKLKKIGDSGRRYAKHFLDLGGLGIRDMCVHGNDILILAGPAMHLDGTFTVYRWKGGCRAENDSIHEKKSLERLFDVIRGNADRARDDHAEGIALIADNRKSAKVIVVYDSPSSERLKAKTRAEADVFTFKKAA